MSITPLNLAKLLDLFWLLLLATFLLLLSRDLKVLGLALRGRSASAPTVRVTPSSRTPDIESSAHLNLYHIFFGTYAIISFSLTRFT